MTYWANERGMGMAKKRRKAEEIIRIVREADQGVEIPELCKKHGISDVTLARWRKQYGGMGPQEELCGRIPIIHDLNYLPIGRCPHPYNSWTGMATSYC